jgi:hypothetical protein
MKKVTLIVVGLLLTLFSYAQEFVRVTNVNHYSWSGSKWEYMETNKPKDMFIIIKDWNISIGSVKFKTYDLPDKTIHENHTTMSWKCVDELGNNCMFMMKLFKKEWGQYIIYSIVYGTGTMFEYEVE